MALYELDDNQVKNTINWLKSITIQADFDGREKFNTELKSILAALSRPIQPTGKIKELIE